MVGTYGLVVVNESEPGKLVLLSNPNGTAIGLYRFDASTQLVLTSLQSYTLNMKLSDDKRTYQLYDEGDFKWTDTGTLLSLSFESARDGRKYPGLGNPTSIAIKYDTDGDGTPDTLLGLTSAGVVAPPDAGAALRRAACFWWDGQGSARYSRRNPSAWPHARSRPLRRRARRRCLSGRRGG